MTLYRVKLAYSLTVEGQSVEDAHKSVVKQIKESPQLVISSIEDARYAQHRPVWKRLVTGH
jgi:hypothetical protein